MTDPTPLPWPGNDVPALLTLDPAGEDIFISRHNQANPMGVLYGGQVLGQAAAAAGATITGFTMHSLHAYFLRPGAIDSRVTFTVLRIRDGRRFATRRVIASQHGKTIFEMNCSFFQPLKGHEHQTPAPPAGNPDLLKDLRTLAEEAGVKLPSSMGRLTAVNPIDVRPVDGPIVLRRASSPRLRFWVRVPSAARAEDPRTHLQILAYLSDWMLAAASLTTHRAPFADENFEMASLDHAMWFHRPARADEWLLYDTESPNALNGVNLARGMIYDRQGALIATVSQETLQAYRS
jgi:acyl-CoA thioesterase-2